MSNKQPESYWTAVGNIIRERPYGPGGVEIRYGTKHFAPGAKVYIIDWYPGTCDAVTVVGHHRKSHQLMKLVVRVEHLENLRAKVCYSPAVSSIMKEHFEAGDAPYRLTREFAEQLCAVLPHWKAEQQRAKNI
ncbi:hypothetical protein [Hymenobacter yonginensis]|uniref:Uncharacterized protein n=1 Tax=Hymenobacter yonginensis TaxID=748197 RepID=A0ABY7PTE7_9BACT|nr:hypothetical protein [Hymenobacter yonginensis]WBO86187.1 hypothetical protein O9Z63_07985 [Hymenobacter yonginensis]